MSDQICNGDKSGLNRQKMFSRTYLTKNENKAPGFKHQKAGSRYWFVQTFVTLIAGSIY